MSTPLIETAPPAQPGRAALRVVVVNGSPHEKSRTMGLVDVVLDTLGNLLPVTAHRIDVYRLGAGFTGAAERDEVTAEVEAELRAAETADLLVAATPVYRGSYTGLFKHFNPRVYGRIEIALTDVAELLAQRAATSLRPTGGTP